MCYVLCWVLGDSVKNKIVISWPQVQCRDRGVCGGEAACAT
jgi:hypothetical protein